MSKRYLPETITTMLCPYSLNYFAEQLDEIKVGYGGITPMEKFSGTKRDITL